MKIAIDGPAGAGKSTVARRVARALGLPFLDTGAMYRAVALVALERGVDPADEEACAEIAREIELTFDGEGRLLVDGVPREEEIRSPRVDAVVSQVSAHPAVRAAIVPHQRRFAEEAGGVVAEGRDTTTVVFPDADLKVFLTASVEERARRRAAQSGREGEVEAIRREIERRDRLDRERADSPLRVAEDARIVDTDGRTVEEVVEEILALAREVRR